MTDHLLKISIITVVRNNQSYLEGCIKSVIEQKYQNLEYIVIDGGSTDGTLDIINKYRNKISIVVSEPDHGIYYAMNKGILLASGDIIGILNSDDFYSSNEVLNNVVDEFNKKGVDSVFADLVYVDRENTDKIVRYYKSEGFKPLKFSYGWMPAHPTFFLRRMYYEKYGLFNTSYKIASDFELLARLLGKHNLSYSYLPKVIVKMRQGGISTSSLESNWILNREIIRACRENGIQTNALKIISKYFMKSLQLIERPSSSRY